jgi:HNH endonuclease
LEIPAIFPELAMTRTTQKRPWEEQFFEKIRKTEDGCWIWMGGTNGKYPVFHQEGERKPAYAHRLSYEHFIGPILPGYDIAHDPCNIPLCVNPAHLKAATRKANVNRSSHKNQKTHRTGICQRGHRIEGENAMVGKDGRIRCRECFRLRHKTNIWF